MCTNYSNIMKFLKTSFLFLSLIFLSGCLQTTSLLAPSMTVAATGNVFQAGLQYGANTAIKNETGKDTLEHFKDAVEIQSKDKQYKGKLTELMKKKYQEVRQKLSIN